jgi:iron-sulfur cluster assembly protein
MTINITEKAKSELVKLDIGQDSFLRIDIIPGGCSGMTYSAAVDTELKAGDETLYQDEDIRIVADGGSAMFLDGLKIDYSDDLIKSGFRFLSPNSVKSCGCGASFSA